MARPEYELRNRALRLLTDHHKHDQQTVEWARKVLRQARDIEEMQQAGFTLRELSLGAQKYWGVPS